LSGVMDFRGRHLCERLVLVYLCHQYTNCLVPVSAVKETTPRGDVAVAGAGTANVELPANLKSWNIECTMG